MRHKPVLLREVIDNLNLKEGAVVLDGTLGSAGHAVEILKAIGESGKYIGLDQDHASITRCQEKLKDFGQAVLRQSNFEHFDKILSDLNIEELDAVILDIGLSSDQLEDGDRGFSFERSGPLDMRMDPSQEKVRAEDLINALSKKELADIFWKYGEERYSRQFAEAIFKKRPLHTTEELVEAVESVLPAGLKKAYQRGGKRPPWAKRHPATRIFQALRIAVNDELGVLERALPKMWQTLKAGGRFGVISFHSLEDRIVKNYFRELKQKKEAVLITKKPLSATDQELQDNPRARSAKLRVVEKVSV